MVERERDGVVIGALDRDEKPADGPAGGVACVRRVDAAEGGGNDLAAADDRALPPWCEGDGEDALAREAGALARAWELSDPRAWEIDPRE